MIDRKKLITQDAFKTTYRIIKSWTLEGHEIIWAWFEIVRPHDMSHGKGKTLLCECDFDFEIANGSKKFKNDPHECQHKKYVRDVLIPQESIREYGETWKAMGCKQAILDIFEKVKNGKLFGKYKGDVIYIQEVARLLGETDANILKLCDELFAEEQLSLNGAILIPYVSRFRFPKEIQHLLAYLIEEPLGWPNGEAGDCFLEEIEGVITEYTNFKTGKKVFGDHYPHLSPQILINFGGAWIQSGVSKLCESKSEECDLQLQVNYLKSLIDYLKVIVDETDKTMLSIQSKIVPEKND
ncbi:MAG: hypothetical protein WCW87_02085 [Candidatus Paceibacterota bacterium]